MISPTMKFFVPFTIRYNQPQLRYYTRKQELPMSEYDKIIRFLHTVPLFNGLDEPHLQRLGRRFTERSYTKGQAIVNQGTLGIGLFIVESGAAEAIRQNPDGSKNTVNRFKPTE